MKVKTQNNDHTHNLTTYFSCRYIYIKSCIHINILKIKLWSCYLDRLINSSFHLNCIINIVVVSSVFHNKIPWAEWLNRNLLSHSLEAGSLILRCHYGQVLERVLLMCFSKGEITPEEPWNVSKGKEPRTVLARFGGRTARVNHRSRFGVTPRSAYLYLVPWQV